VSRKGSNHVGDTALQIAFMRSLGAQMDNGTNVSFDDFA